MLLELCLAIKIEGLESLVKPLNSNQTGLLRHVVAISWSALFSARPTHLPLNMDGHTGLN